jgi:MFS family permease
MPATIVPKGSKEEKP